MYYIISQLSLLMFIFFVYFFLLSLFPFFSASSSGLRQPLQLTPQRRFSHAGFGMHQSNAGSGQQDNIVIPKRKISLFHNMKFNGTILEEQAAAHAAAAAEQQKKEFGLNPNAPSFNMQQYAAHRYVLNRYT